MGHNAVETTPAALPAEPLLDSQCATRREQTRTNTSLHVARCFAAFCSSANTQIDYLIRFFLARVCSIHAALLNASSPSCANNHGGLTKGICRCQFH